MPRRRKAVRRDDDEQSGSDDDFSDAGGGRAAGDDEDVEVAAGGPPRAPSGGAASGGTTGAALAKEGVAAQGIASGRRGGIILKVVMKDFMCHEKLEIGLARGINFITGRNGSGKSAVAVAVRLALGRGSGSRGNLVDLIRHGKDVALVEVTITNSGGGEDDVLPSVTYGDRITFRRTIRRVRSRTAGAPQKAVSKLEIVDAHGRPITTMGKPTDLRDEICRSFNIDVASPFVIMPQDDMKRFAQSAGAELYKVFLSGSGLEDHFRNSIQAHERVDSLGASIRAMEGEMGKRHAILAKCDHRMDVVRQVKRAGARLKHAQAALEWSKVKVMQDRVRECEADMETTRLAQSRVNASIKKRQEALDEADERLKALDMEKDVLERERVAKSKKVTEARGAYQGAREKARGKHRYCKEIRAKVSEARQLLAKRERELQELHRQFSMVSKDQEALVKLEESMKPLERERAEAGEAAGEMAEKLELANEAYREQEETAVMARRAAKTTGHEVRKIREALDELGRGGGSLESRASMIDSSHVELMRAVKEGGFSEPAPIGPLGAYVEMKPEMPHVTRSIMGVLAGRRNTWVVKDRTDYRRLMELMGQRRWRPQVVVLPPRPELIEGIHEAARRSHEGAHVIPKETSHILDVIDVRDSWALTTLADLVPIKKTMVVTQLRHGQDELAFANSTVRGHEGWQIALGGGRILKNLRGNIEQEMGETRDSWLMVNPARAIEEKTAQLAEARANQERDEELASHEEAKLRKLKAERDEVETQHVARQDHFALCTRHWKEARDQAMRLRKRIHGAAGAKEFEDEDEELQAAIKDARDALAGEEETLVGATAELAEANEAEKRKREALEALEDELQNLSGADREAEQDRLRQKKARHVEKIQELVRVYEQTVEQLLDLDNRHNARLAEIDEAKAKVLEDLDVDAIPKDIVEMTEVQARAEIKACEAMLADEERIIRERIGMSSHEAESEYRAARSRYTALKQKVEQFRGIRKSTTSFARGSFRSAQILRKAMTKRVGDIFASLMQGRGHLAKLAVDFDEDEFSRGSMLVEVHPNVIASTGDAKALAMTQLLSADAPVVSRKRGRGGRRRRHVHGDDDDDDDDDDYDDGEDDEDEDAEARKRKLAVAHAHNVARDTGTLSGGEKTMTAVCLLHAFAGIMGSPFVMWDELDVFLDEASRATAFRIAIAEARRAHGGAGAQVLGAGRQYVFLTPHDISDVVAEDGVVADDIRVFAMEDPGRSLGGAAGGGGGGGGGGAAGGGAGGVP